MTVALGQERLGRLVEGRAEHHHLSARRSLAGDAPDLSVGSERGVNQLIGKDRELGFLNSRGHIAP